MIVLREDGVNRHLRFKQPSTNCYYFDLITWPGCLCLTGDMGTYVFKRLDDMFEFFRTDRQHAAGDGLKINRSYWSEKLIAVDSSGRRGGSAVEFSPEKFQRMIKEQLVTWWREKELTSEERKELRKEVESEILSACHDGETRAFDAVNDFSHTVGGRTYQFQDWWEVNCTDYTFHFTWCCYALAWGIRQYDAAKPLVSEAA